MGRPGVQLVKYPRGVTSYITELEIERDYYQKKVTLMATYLSEEQKEKVDEAMASEFSS